MCQCANLIICQYTNVPIGCAIKQDGMCQLNNNLLMFPIGEFLHSFIFSFSNWHIGTLLNWHIIYNRILVTYDDNRSSATNPAS